MEIVEYDDRHQNAFRDLNIEWLVQYNLLEPHDEAMLNNPRNMIIDTGGVIYLAVENDVVVGSAALVREHDHVYELVKMAVAKEHRNKGISRLLIERCIDQVKSLGGVRIVLFSNHQLRTALGLYEKYGFRYIPVEHSPFETADIKMELVLSP